MDAATASGTAHFQARLIAEHLPRSPAWNTIPTRRRFARSLPPADQGPSPRASRARSRGPRAHGHRSNRPSLVSSAGSCSSTARQAITTRMHRSASASRSSPRAPATSTTSWSGGRPARTATRALFARPRSRRSRPASGVRWAGQLRPCTAAHPMRPVRRVSIWPDAATLVSRARTRRSPLRASCPDRWSASPGVTAPLAADSATEPHEGLIAQRGRKPAPCASRHMGNT
jgi:hypothetical protein